MANTRILNQIIDEQGGTYRIQIGNKVGYVNITADIFDEDTMCRPYLLIPKLPEFPDKEWTRISITRADTGANSDDLNIIATNDPLPEVVTTWHNKRIDVPSLKETKYIKSNVREVLYNGVPVISKIAAFDWEIPRVEKETWAYSILDEYQREHPGAPLIAPRVLGHLTECGRVIGLLLERLEGSFASIKNLPDCKRAIRLLHQVGLIHGDVCRYNFIIGQPKSLLRLIDFEHASAFDEATAKVELQSLPSELEEDSGRGRPAFLL